MKTHKVSSFGLLFSSAALLLAASLASAQTTVTATSTDGGNWTATGTWTCSPTLSPCVPNNGTPTGDTYNVGINGGVGLDNFSTLTAVTIDSLSASGSLLIEAEGTPNVGVETLNVTDNITGGELDVLGGTLNVGGNVSHADLVVDDGAVAIAGTLTNSSVDVAGGPLALTASLTVGGPVPSTLTGGYNVDFGGSVTFGSGEVTAIGSATSSASLYMEGGGGGISVATSDNGNPFTHLTMIAKGSGVELDAAGISTAESLTNNGSVTLDGGLLSVAGNLTNDGRIGVDDGCYDYACGQKTVGILAVDGSLTNNGSMSVALGSANHLFPGGELSVGGNLTNNGVLTLGSEYDTGSSSPLSVGGNFTNIGGASVNVGTLNVAGTLTNESVLLQGRDAYGRTVNTGGLWLGNDAVVTAAAVNNSGGILIDNGSQLTVNASGPYNQSAGLTDVNGTTLVATDVNINGGTLMGTGTIEGSATGGAAAVTIGSGATIQPGNAMQVYGSLTLSGIFDENIDSASNFGALYVGGTADIAGGTLDINLPDGDSFLTSGETFPILFAAGGGLSGTFSTINGLDFGTGGTWLVNYTADEVILTAHTPEPASLLLFGTGLLGLGLLLTRRRTAPGK